MSLNLLNQFQRRMNREGDPSYSGGTSGRASAHPEGLSARLAASFTGDGSETPVEAAPVVATPPVESQEKPEVKPVVDPTLEPKPKDDPKPDPKPEEKPAEDEDEEFPEIGGKPKTDDKPDGELDEAAFDAETESFAKKMPADAMAKFKELRAELKSIKKQGAPTDIPAEAKQKLDDYDRLKEEAEGLRQRNEAMMKRADVQSVMESPDYVERVAKPVEAMENVVASMAEIAKIDPNDLFRIIMETDIGKQDAAIEALTGKLGVRGVNRLAKFADDWKEINSTKADLLKDAGKTLQASRERTELEAAEEQKAFTGRFQGATRESFKSYAQRVPGFTDSSGNLTETAKAAQAKAVSVDVHTLSEGDLAYMTFTTQAFPALRRELVRLQAENATLVAGGGTGALGGKAPTDAKADKPGDGVREDGKPKGLAERMQGQTFSFTPGQ